LVEIRDVAPCADCGHDQQEIDHALSGKHTYDLVRLFGRFTLILCDFCQVDFASYDPTYFGLAKGVDPLEASHLEFLKRIDQIYIGKDKFCPKCQHRQIFLDFVDKCRKLHEQKS
jgi:hypothetical protein